MKNITITIALLILSSYSLIAQDYTLEIKESTQEFILNIENEKYKEAVDMMHPNILKMGGGKESMAIILTEERSMLTSQGYEVLDSEVLEPSELVKSGDELHTIVPVKQLVKIGNAKFYSTSYLLAASLDGGKSWTLSKLDGHDNESITFFFPKWNSDLIIPEPVQSIAIDTKE